MKGRDYLSAIGQAYYSEFNRRFGVTTDQGETAMTELQFWAMCAAAVEIEKLVRENPEICRVEHVWNDAGFSVKSVRVDAFDGEDMPLTDQSAKLSGLVQEFLAVTL